MKSADYYDSLPYKMVVNPVRPGRRICGFFSRPAGMHHLCGYQRKGNSEREGCKTSSGLRPRWKTMWKSMNQRFKFKESYIISKNFMQWSLEAMEKDLQQQYLDTESNSRLFFDTFFELCRKFNIQYSIATTQEKAFIDEVTESIYERKKAERDGKAPTYQQRV